VAVPAACAAVAHGRAHPRPWSCRW
jgi:hypothetical protein